MLQDVYGIRHVNDSISLEHIFDNVRVTPKFYKVKNGMYALHLARWLQYFPIQQIHVVNGDVFVQRPWVELEKIETFLGQEHELDASRFVYNIEKGFYCFRGEHGEEMCMSDGKGRRHPDLQPELLQSLRNFYKPWNEKFYTMVGEDFGWDS